jgi:hypothetical protein
MYLDYDNVVVQQGYAFVKLTGAGSRNADSDRSLFQKELTEHIFGLMQHIFFGLTQHIFFGLTQHIFGADATYFRS